jgi:HSP20 family molecular chaperone IbpA
VRGEQTIASVSDSAVPRIKHGYRAFARRFVLSKPVEADAMATIYTHGVLAVHLPKEVEVFDQQSPIYMAP